MTYEYVCSACSFHWEAEQSISEPPLTTCPSCNADTARRQVSGGQGFILRGGGWYADGYGSKKPASSETASPSKSEGGKAETGKSESTPSTGSTPAKTG